MYSHYAEMGWTPRIQRVSKNYRLNKVKVLENPENYHRIDLTERQMPEQVEQAVKSSHFPE